MFRIESRDLEISKYYSNMTTWCVSGQFQNFKFSIWVSVNCAELRYYSISFIKPLEVYIIILSKSSRIDYYFDANDKFG